MLQRYDEATIKQKRAHIQWFSHKSTILIYILT